MKKRIYKDFEYLVLQMPMGHLCGYVKVPSTHRFYGKDYDSIDVDCHGGLTYSYKSDGKPFKLDQKPNFGSYFTKGYWIGFDYAHSGDWSFYSHDDFNEKYNSITQPFEVEDECKKVIDQLVKIK